jgi:hypothetical protein
MPLFSLHFMLNISSITGARAQTNSILEKLQQLQETEILLKEKSEKLHHVEDQLASIKKTADR